MVLSDPVAPTGRWPFILSQCELHLTDDVVHLKRKS